MRDEVNECNKKLTDIKQVLSIMEGLITKWEKFNELLQKENKDLRENTELLETHSRKLNLRIFCLPRDIEK